MNWEEGKLLLTGKYSIVKFIGVGGFGQTYLAEQRFLHKQVVIKRPRPDFRYDRDYDKYVRRFQREGQVLLRIDHPNVVKAIDLFEDEGMPCLVMEYVAGETLYEYIRRQNYMPQDRAVECFQQLAATLQIVHEEDLIHCDIHPGNIIKRSIFVNESMAGLVAETTRCARRDKIISTFSISPARRTRKQA